MIGTVEEMNAQLGDLTGLKKETEVKTDTPELKSTETTSEIKDTSEVKTDDKVSTPEVKSEVSEKFNFDKVKEHFGFDYESEDDFRKELSTLPELRKSIESNQTKYTELETNYTDVKGKNEELNAILQELEVENPLSFLSEAQYKALKVANDNPHLDSSILVDLANSDLDKLDGFDLLVKNTIMKGGGKYTPQDVMEVLAEEKGLDLSDYRNWNAKEKLKFEREADAVRGELREMFSTIELPKKVDLENIRKDRADKSAKQYQDNLAKFSEAFKELGASEGIGSNIKFKDNDLDLNYDFKYEFDSSYKDNIQKLVENYASNGQELSNDLVQQTKTVAEGIFLAENFDKILKTAVEDAYSKFKQSQDKELHNPEIPRQEAPKDLEEHSNETFIKNAPWNKFGNIGL